MALLLSAASKQIRNDGDHHNESGEQYKSADDQHAFVVPSQAFQAAILEALRSIRNEEYAKERQERADHRDWSTPAFWVNVALAFVGTLYTIFAALQWRSIHRQADIAERSLRAEVTLGRPDGILAEILPPSIGHRLAIKLFFYNSGRTAAQDFRIRVAISYGRGNPKGIELGPEPVRKQVVVQGYPAIEGRITSTIGAGAVQPHIAYSDEALVPDEVDSIHFRTQEIFFFGKFEYSDGFGKEDIYRTFQILFDPDIRDFVVMDGPFRGGRDRYPFNQST
jgi:hypothetical protein